jgi:hypothetical protein
MNGLVPCSSQLLLEEGDYGVGEDLPTPPSIEQGNTEERRPETSCYDAVPIEALDAIDIARFLGDTVAWLLLGLR